MIRRIHVFGGLMVVAILLLAFSGVATAAKGGAGTGGTGGSGCSIAPGQVALDQPWIVSGWGLPSSVNLIITFPSGGQSIGPVTVASNGTYTESGNSNMSATWGFIAPEQTGTYTYQFVGRIKWPAGTYSRSYGTCSVVVS